MTYAEPLTRSSLRNALWLAYHPRLKPAQRLHLAQRYGHPDQVVAHAGLTLDVQEQSRIDAWEEASLEWLASSSERHVLFWGDAFYPQRLKHLPDPPLILFAQGNLDTLCDPTIAMVGSRNASKSGLDTSFHVAAWLAQRGWCIVSGLACGIDGASHRGALSVQGPTIAVMGTGVDTIYPREHSGMAQQIVQSGGLLLSEYPPGTPPRQAFFPRRNRIIAGLCHGLVVVEAALKSGSLITAKQANHIGRLVMAVPGSIHSTHARGCHVMIRAGATLVNNGIQIEEDTLPSVELERKIRIQQRQEPATTHLAHPDRKDPRDFDALSRQQQEILGLVGFDPTGLDELVQETDLSASRILTELTFLEMDHWIASEPGQRWCRLR